MNSLRDRLSGFLQWCERYIKTDMAYLLTGGFWLGIAQLAASIVGFALTIVLANMLSPSTFGEYRFLMAGFLLLSITALPGMRTAVMESTSKGFSNSLRRAFVDMAKFGVIGTVISLAIAGYYLWMDNLSLALGFSVIALALPLFDSSSVYLDYLKGLKNFKLVGIYTLITRIIVLVSVIGFAFIYPDMAWIILAVFLLSNVLPNVFLTKRVDATCVKDDQMDAGLPRYAKHLTAMAVLSLAAIQLDKIFIWSLIGAEELAMFYIAYAIPVEAGRFLHIIPTLAFPKFATMSAETVKQTLMSKMWKLFFIILLVVIAYILIAPTLFSVLFPQYIDAVAYTQVLMLTALVSAFTPISAFFAAHKATKILYFLSVILPTVRILSALLLIILYGLWGAVWALIIEATLRIFLLLFLFRTYKAG